MTAAHPPPVHLESAPLIEVVARDVAAGRTGVWLLSQITEVSGPSGGPSLVDRGARLTRIAPATGRALARIDVPVAAGRLVQGRSGRLWVIGSRLAVIDPRTRSVDLVAGARCERLVADARPGIWSYSPCSRALTRRAPTGEPIGRPVPLPGPPAVAMALGDAGLFLTRRVAGRAVLERRDPRSGRLLRRTRVAGPPDGLALRGGSVWALGGTTGALDRLDPITLRRVSRIPLPFLAPGGGRLAVGGGAAWVADAYGRRITRVEPRTERPRTRALTPVPRDTMPVAVAPGPRAVWIVTLSDGTRSALCRLAPRDGAVERCFVRSA